MYPVTCRGELKFLTSIFKLNRLTVILSIAISLICIILFRTDSTNIAKTYLKLFDFNYDLQFFAGKFASPVGDLWSIQMKFVALPAQVKVQFILRRFKITIYARF